MTPVMSVLLCSYNREHNVKRCLAALANQTLSKDQYEVICVNDGSSDQTGLNMQEALRNGVPGRYIEHETNKALAAGRNSAIRAARGEFVVFINDDTYPEPNFLEEHLKLHRRFHSPYLAVLGFLPFVPELRDRVFSRVLMEHDLYFNFAKLKAHQTYPFWYFVTGNLSVPRHWFSKENIWFDETFLRYGFEDIECGYRMWRRGMRVLYHQDAVAQHEHKITIENYLTRAVDNGTNILQFAAKHPDRYIAYTLLNTLRITDAVLAEWKQNVATAAPQVSQLTQHISSLQDRILVPDGIPDGEQHRTLAQIADGTRGLGDYVKFKTFVETLEKYPRLKQILMSDEWFYKSERLYRRADISEVSIQVA